ncbi:M20 family metallopeptidase [Streptomyces sp. NPDC055189]
MDFDGLLGAKRRDARKELAETMRTLCAQQEPDHAALGSAPAEAFFEPRLYSQLVLGGFPSMTADQLLLAAAPDRSSTLSVRTDTDGVAFLPGLGRCTTDQNSAELLVNYDADGRTLTTKPGGTPDTVYGLEASSLVPGTSMELVDRLDPVLDGFLRLHVDRYEELSVVTDVHAHLPHISRALDLIALVSPSYHAALTESLRGIFLFRHPTAESFAALGMHGLIFLNVPETAGAEYFVEELVHQGGHVLFSEATLNRGDFLCVDPDTSLSDLLGQDDPRDVYGAFHGLFTEHMEYHIVLGVLETGLANDEERSAFQRHLATVARRHRRDLQLIGRHAAEIFSPLGQEVFAAFRAANDRAAGLHPHVLACAVDAEELLHELIAIPSVNPLLPGSDGIAHEADLAAFVAGRLRSAGISVEMQEVVDGRCNVIAHLTRAGDADDEVVLLSAHMDTYPAGGPRAGYQPVGEGRTLYGRGSADAKGSLAAMMTAFLQVATVPNRRECYLAATVDEECLILGAKALATHGMRPTLGITGEPSGLVPVVAQKGIVRGSFRVRGPKIHAAYPHGATAVGSAAELVRALERVNGRLGTGPSHPDLGSPTIVVTRLESDGGMNLGATEVVVWFDARFLPGSSGEDFVARVEHDLRELLPQQVDFVLDPLAFVSPPNEVSPASSLVSEFFTAVKNVTGACEPDSFSYGSEAGVLAEFCQSSLVFGPGDARYSHADVEAIDLDELGAATHIFRSILVGDQR